MKTKIATLLSFIFLCFSLYSQDRNSVYYYFQGDKIFLTVRQDKMLIKLAQDANKESLLALIQSDESVELQGGLTNNFVILKAKNNDSIPIETIAKYKQNHNVVSAFYMLEYQGKTQGLTDEFIVQLKVNTELQQLQDLATMYQCSMKENQFVENQFLMSVNKISSFNSLQLANLFHETDLFEFAEPNFFIENLHNLYPGAGAIQAQIPEKKRLTIYPNPVLDRLNIVTDGAQMGDRIEIFDIHGQCVVRQEVRVKGVETIDVSQLLPGTYILKLGDLSAKFVN